MSYREDGKIQYSDFESLGELLDYVEKTPRTAGANKASEDNAESFSGSKSFADAINIARSGWPEGVNDISSVDIDLSALSQDDDMLANATEYGVTGARPCISSFVAGVPDYMMTESWDDASAPVIRIGVNVTASAMVDAKQFTRRGRALVAYIDHVEHSGIAVELVAVLQVRMKGNSDVKHIASTMIKAASQPLDLGWIAFSMCHPSMLRRIGFKLIETLPNAAQWCRGGHGYSFDSTDKNGCDVFINSIGNYENNTTATQWIDKIGKELNRQLDESNS